MVLKDPKIFLPKGNCLPTHYGIHLKRLEIENSFRKIGKRLEKSKASSQTVVKLTNHPKRLEKTKITSPRFCCTAAITTSGMLLKPEGTNSKIRPFSRTFFRTIAVSKFSSRRPGSSFRSASSTKKLSASLNRCTESTGKAKPSGKATREKVEAAEAEACEAVMLTLLAST